jgi:hypothetical protein
MLSIGLCDSSPSWRRREAHGVYWRTGIYIYHGDAATVHHAHSPWLDHLAQSLKTILGKAISMLEANTQNSSLVVVKAWNRPHEMP